MFGAGASTCKQEHEVCDQEKDCHGIHDMCANINRYIYDMFGNIDHDMYGNINHDMFGNVDHDLYGNETVTYGGKLTNFS